MTADRLYGIVVGWYSIGSTPLTSDLALHTQILTYNESPIFLQLHPDAMQASGSSDSRAASKLPLDIYESVVDIAGGKSETKFVKIATEAGGYKVETYEAERIAVESASKVGAASAGTAGQGGKAQQETTESTRESIHAVTTEAAKRLLIFFSIYL
jgi:COP9 signalosome complex subunit 6